MRIAVLGLGKMGQPMVRNLLELGHAVTVYNRTPGKAKGLVDQGAREASTVAEAVARVEVAITVLSDEAAVRAVVEGPGGLLEALPRKAIHLCMGTLGVPASAALAEAHAAAGQGYVAAPVFGRPSAAAARQLWIMAAGPESQVVTCIPLLEALGRTITRVGERAEMAHAAKLGGALLSSALVEALSEALAFGERAGLAPVDYLRLLNTGLVKSPLLDAYGGLIVRRSFDPADHTLAAAARDTQLVLEASRAQGLGLPMAELLHRRLEAAEALGLGGLDLAALSQVSRAAGPTPPEPSPMSHAMPEGPFAPEAPAPPAWSGLRGVLAQARQRMEVAFRRTPSEATELTLQAAPAGVPLEGLSVPVSEAEGDSPAPSPLAPARSRPSGRKRGVPEATEVPAPADPQEPVRQPEPVAAAEEDTGAQVPDLERTSHFELVAGRVRAWSGGQSIATPWRSFREVEQAFPLTLFIPVGPGLLLRPEAALEVLPAPRGGARVRVGENQELLLNRQAAERLKVVLGL